MRLALLSALNRARAERRLCALVTPLDGGEGAFLYDGGACESLAGEFKEQLRTGDSGIVEADGRRFFIDIQKPPFRLIIIGAVHIAQALAPMAQLAGFDVIIVDPRTAFAASDRFSDTRLMAQWPEDAFASLRLDAFTAVATLTHDPKIDDRALRLALASECFYVGALGSRKTHQRRLERLLDLEPAALARLRAPIGLDIGAGSPAEIAVSILGEIILAKRKKPLRCESEIERPALSEQ